MSLHEIWQNLLDLEYSGKIGFNLSIYSLITFGCIYSFYRLFSSHKWYEKYKNKILFIEKRFPKIESENLMVLPFIIAIVFVYHFSNLDNILFYFVSETIPTFWRNLF